MGPLQKADRTLARKAWRIARRRKGRIAIAAFLIAAAFGWRGWLSRSEGYNGTEFRFYGNHCGPGHGTDGEPIDELDAACREHDRAYYEQFHRPLSGG